MPCSGTLRALAGRVYSCCRGKDRVGRKTELRICFFSFSCCRCWLLFAQHTYFLCVLQQRQERVGFVVSVAEPLHARSLRKQYFLCRISSQGIINGCAPYTASAGIPAAPLQCTCCNLSPLSASRLLPVCSAR